MVVRVSVPPAGAGGLRLDATLVDGVGARVSQLIGARFVPVDVCRLRADGTTPRDLIAVPDGKPGVLGECTLVSGPSPSPSDAPISTAMRLRYRTGKGERFFRVEIAPESRRPLSGKPRSLGIWVRGDDNGNLNFIRMRFLDASGQQFQTLGERIKWRGWRYVSFPINAAEATHTGGDDDGIIHYPVRILAPLVMWNGYGRAVEGEIAFACPMVVY